MHHLELEIGNEIQLRIGEGYAFVPGWRRSILLSYYIYTKISKWIFCRTVDIIIKNNIGPNIPTLSRTFIEIIFISHSSVI